MRLRWSGTALDDLDRIAMFNEERSVEWARRANHRIVERCNSLTRLPRQGRQIARSTRRVLSLPDIQYVVSYDVSETKFASCAFEAHAKSRIAHD